MSQENPSQALRDRLHVRGVQAPGDQSHKVQSSDVLSKEDPGQASGDRLHLPGSTRNPEITKPGALDFEDDT